MALIALDYDGTYTAMPAVWDRFIADAEKAGHVVVCMTMRRPEETIKVPCPVVYTSREAKMNYAERMGLKVSIWIDDSPHWLFADG